MFTGRGISQVRGLFMAFRSIGMVLAGMGLVSCTPAEHATAVVGGQLFCARATPAGPLVVALADAAGVPVAVSGLASDLVAADCALISAIPVTPPANPAAAPTVAAPIHTTS